ncbi:MAG: apolipoprotein N-acyltransferase [Pseudomonadota bacterium]
MMGKILQSVQARVVLLEGWRAILVAVLAGAASALAQAPYHGFFILWLTIPLFIWLLDGAVPRIKADGRTGVLGRFAPPFFVGWWFGFGYFLAGLWWIGQAFLVDGDEFAWLLPIAVLVLPAGLALFWGFAAAFARIISTEGWNRVIALAVMIALAEWLRGTVLTGFPWNAIGYALMPTPLFMQSAAFVGLYGMSFFAILVFGVLAPFGSAALSDEGRSGARFGRLVGPRAGVLFVLVLGVAHTSYGFVALQRADTVADVAGMNLRLVQPAIRQSEKWDRANEADIMARYFDLTNANRGPDAASVAAFTHVVWPESAFPFILTDRRDQLAAIAALLPKDTTLITGAMRIERSASPSNPSQVFNALLVLNGSGEIVAASDKTRLVPFGEFLPFQGFLEGLGFQQLTQQQGGFARGTVRQVMSVPGTPAFLPLICYEIIFSGAVEAPLGTHDGKTGADAAANVGTNASTKTSAEGGRPRFIVNLTNDAWFGTTAGPYQHAHQAQVRAAETGLPVVRAANSGISFVTDGAGRVRAQLGLDIRGVVDSRLPGALPPTVFSQLGNLPILAMLGLLFLILVGIRLFSTSKL